MPGRATVACSSTRTGRGAWGGLLAVLANEKLMT
jgi:hypothetical protein